MGKAVSIYYVQLGEIKWVSRGVLRRWRSESESGEGRRVNLKAEIEREVVENSRDLGLAKRDSSRSPTFE